MSLDNEKHTPIDTDFVSASVEADTLRIVLEDINEEYHIYKKN